MLEKASLYQVLFNIVLWLLAFYLLWPALKEPYKVKGAPRVFGVLTMLIFCLYAFWGGDYFHYKIFFADYFFGGYMSVEWVYGWIIDNLSFHSYTLFRFIIWGVALLLLFSAYKKSSPSFDLCLLIFGVCYVHLFSYARASLPMAMVIFGLVLLSDAFYKKKTILMLLGFAFIGFSEIFHRSAVVGIVAAMASFFLVNAKKKTLWFFLFISPIIILAMQYTLDSFMSYDLDYDTYITGRQRDVYMLGEMSSIWGEGWGERIMIIFTRVPLYLSAFIYVKLVINGNYLYFSRLERVVSSYAFCIIILGIGFAFNWGYNTSILHYRTLNFALPANAVFLAAVHRHGYNKKLFNIIWWSTILGVFYSLLYSTYNAM